MNNPFGPIVDDEMLQCFLNHLDVDAEHPFALDYQTIATAQDHDPELQQKLANKPQQYARIAMSNDVNVICYIPEPNTPWRICLPTAMLHNTVRWYPLFMYFMYIPGVL
jgi:hypothetical protein